MRSRAKTVVCKSGTVRRTPSIRVASRYPSGDGFPATTSLAPMSDTPRHSPAALSRSSARERGADVTTAHGRPARARRLLRGLPDASMSGRLRFHLPLIGRADLPQPALRRASHTGTRPRPTAHPSPAHTAPAAAAEPWLGLLDRRVKPRALGRFESTPEVRPLPSAGITRPPRYYEPVRHPSAARPFPRGPPLGRSSPPPLGLPVLRPSHQKFRGRLSVHSRNGLLARGTAWRSASKASGLSLPPSPLRLLPAGAKLPGGNYPR